MIYLPRSSLRWLLWMSLALGAALAAHAQSSPAIQEEGAAGPGASSGLVAWLKRMHEASRANSYIGTFVVSAPGGDLSSARIWHACDRIANTQVERVETLTGPPRSTFRHDDQVVTFFEDSRVVRREKRSDFEQFPSVGKPDDDIAQHYEVKQLGKGRVAGYATDVIQLVPRDSLRFGYRIWVEKRTGLLTKLQTLAVDGRVVEQSAFSELELDAPVSVAQLSQMMTRTEGYRMEKVQVERTSAQAEGWALKEPVPGFRSMRCLRRAMGASGQTPRTTQCIFSDGLASVSLFLEPYDPDRAAKEGLLALGATYTLTRRLSDGGGDWWLTAVGEVPPQTLERFAATIERIAR
ncbi:MucB/RseB C-terminal domain-containing protein [Variovorax dokdonensis]|uniref:MucB/RseB C-terminal domain-containing protein n=1 Tax=Variovorax dokdonensis TaxID=344883 RepID=A0ABT7N6K8_9BURK|nr:MucB/RseB C-terminal domain-containing protein [Variovorax dokdonensis]MDM0043563.1 MucB/RseB C-terminal domain-containing protein [Variovorax dokdonensis]